MMQKEMAILQNLLIHLGVDLTQESVYLRWSKADVTVVTDDNAECLFGLSLSPAQCGVLNLFGAMKGLPLQGHCCHGNWNQINKELAQHNIQSPTVHQWKLLCCYM